jgi:hypothetical protein
MHASVAHSKMHLEQTADILSLRLVLLRFVYLKNRERPPAGISNRRYYVAVR